MPNEITECQTKIVWIKIAVIFLFGWHGRSRCLDSVKCLGVRSDVWVSDQDVWIQSNVWVSVQKMFGLRSMLKC